MNKAIIFILTLFLVAVYGCVNSQITFEKGVKKLNEFDEQYGASLKSPPATTDEIDGLLAQLTGYNAVNDLAQPLEYLVNFKINFLESEKLHAEGWQWGRASTTDYGFGCREGYARISESARLRNHSALKGYETVNALQLLVDEYPKEAESVNLTQKDVLFLNAVYFQIEKKALADAKLIESACGNKGYNKTLITK